MRRFTILNLMLLVVALAVVLAALRGANDTWAGGLLLATPGLFLVALIMATCGKRSPRPSRLGFAILGGGYFALAFLGLNDQNLRYLPTSKLLEEVHQRVVGPLQITISGSLVVTGSPASIQMAPTSPAAVAANGNTSQTFSIVRTPGTFTVNRWSAILPGAANREAFLAIGHCLFALMFGVVGWVMAKWAHWPVSRSEGEFPAASSTPAKELPPTAPVSD